VKYGGKTPKYNESTEGLRIDAFVREVQFAEDVVAMKIDGAGGPAHQAGDFLGAFELPDTVILSEPQGLRAGGQNP